MVPSVFAILLLKHWESTEKYSSVLEMRVHTSSHPFPLDRPIGRLVYGTAKYMGF
jgi:hypothetical protein